MSKRKMQVSFEHPVAFLADAHLGNFKAFGGVTAPDGLNDRGRATVDTLSWALRRAVGLGCAHVFVAGDVFHHRRPEPAVVAAAQAVLADVRDEVAVHLLPGNHDLIDGTALGGNTACAPLARQAHVLRGWEDVEVDNHSATAPGPGALVRCVPFEGGKPMAKFISEVTANFKSFSAVRALCTHVGVVDDDSPPWLREAGDAIHVDALLEIMEREDISAAFVGNYHEHREWHRRGRHVVQVGVLNPTGFADPGLDAVGGLAVWYGDRIEWEQVPGPRFVKVPRGQALPEVPRGCRVHVRSEEPFPTEDVGRFAGYESAPPEAADQPAQAGGGKLVDGAEAALAEYVEKAVMPEGVGKAEVLDAARRLWKGAA